MLEPNLIPAIEAALRDLRFGMVQLIVHEGQLVQIERVERMRVNSNKSTIRLTGTSGSPQQPHGRPKLAPEARLDQESDDASDRSVDRARGVGRQ